MHGMCSFLLYRDAHLNTAYMGTTDHPIPNLEDPPSTDRLFDPLMEICIAYRSDLIG